MERDFDGEEVKRPRTWLWILLLLLAMFLGGMFAAGYAVTHNVKVARFLHLVPAEQAAADAALAQHVAAQAAPVAPPLPAVAPDPALGARIAALEDKVDGIEAQAKEATGDASRAEGLLVAFAARRALDRGVELGYIEGLLRQRFGQSQPQAVAMILSASRLPVTLADLQTGLDAAAPTLTVNGGEAQGSWWQSLRQELGNLVVLRRADEPSSQPADRVARAQRMVEAGQVDSALAEIVRLPDHAAANAWIVSARRYLAGRGALDRIETAALLDPATTAPTFGGPDAATPATVPAPSPPSAAAPTTIIAPQAAPPAAASPSAKAPPPHAAR